MGKKQSNPPPPNITRPTPPPGPPCRRFKNGRVGLHKTKESIRARQDYEVFMRGWRDGINCMKHGNIGTRVMTETFKEAVNKLRFLQESYDSLVRQLDKETGRAPSDPLGYVEFINIDSVLKEMVILHHRIDTVVTKLNEVRARSEVQNLATFDEIYNKCQERLNQVIPGW